MAYEARLPGSPHMIPEPATVRTLRIGVELCLEAKNGERPVSRAAPT